MWIIYSGLLTFLLASTNAYSIQSDAVKLKGESFFV